VADGSLGEEQATADGTVVGCEREGEQERAVEGVFGARADERRGGEGQVKLGERSVDEGLVRVAEVEHLEAAAANCRRQGRAKALAIPALPARTTGSGFPLRFRSRQSLPSDQDSDSSTWAHVSSAPSSSFG
jgi:hypothetical protein